MENNSLRFSLDISSLIYSLYNQSGEPWVYGGEYLALSRHAENLISAWIRVGFRPTFVFDGWCSNTWNFMLWLMFD